MDIVKLAKLRSELGRIKEGQAPMTLPLMSYLAPKKKKKKLSPEAVEALKELQELPPDVWSAGTGPAAALRSAALGGAVGTGVALPILGVTITGRRVPWRKASIKRIAEAMVKTPRRKQLMEEMLRARKIKAIAGTGAAAGLGSGLFLQARRKKLKKKLEKELEGEKKKKKKEASLSLVGMAGQVKAQKILGD
jgi:hypothetical protein